MYCNNAYATTENVTTTHYMNKLSRLTTLRVAIVHETFRADGIAPLISLIIIESNNSSSTKPNGYIFEEKGKGLCE